mgnify:CR=1 FL=1|tara:strand:- start:717 stop:1304 length:588 start_codon:yes stop_codon:yes gene_type:complete
MIDELEIGHEVSSEDLRSVFELCDIDHDGTISLKEFIVTLSLLYLLRAVPTLVSVRSEGKDVAGLIKPTCSARTQGPDLGSPERATKQVDHLKLDQSTPRSESANQDAFLGRSNDIRYLVHWVVAAYLLFDTDCTGSISKDNVKQMQTQREIGDGSDVFLNEDRWQELDWDHNGVVDFEEFVFAFSEWIRDFDDE